MLTSFGMAGTYQAYNISLGTDYAILFALDQAPLANETQRPWSIRSVCAEPRWPWPGQVTHLPRAKRHRLVREECLGDSRAGSDTAKMTCRQGGLAKAPLRTAQSTWTGVKHLCDRCLGVPVEGVWAAYGNTRTCIWKADVGRCQISKSAALGVIFCCAVS
jgi:hypothetical protein